MDPAIIIALVTGALGTIGAAFKVAEVVAGKRPDGARVEIERDAQVTAEVWKLIDELKHDREETRDRADLASAKADEAAKQSARDTSARELLEGRHQNALLRIELLEEGRERDQAMIRELQQEVRQLKDAQQHG